MSILLNQSTKVIVQGITGRDGSFHAKQMKADGTRVVGGVTPGKGGAEVDGIPVFNSVAEAEAAGGADATVIFVPAKFAAAAVKEASEAKIPLIICITEGVPVLDMVEISETVRSRGPVLIVPASIHKPGNIGVISRSGTLTYEVVYALSAAGMGQSTCIGVGGDPIIGTGYIDLLERFEADKDTDAVVLIGEIGGDAEERAAEYIASSMRTPVVSFISGRSAPEGKRMGHAGAIISGGQGTPQAKVAAFEAAGVPVADTPGSIPALVAEKVRG